MSNMKYPTAHVLAKADIYDMDLQYRLDMLATTLWCLIWTADFGTRMHLSLGADAGACLCFDVEVSIPQEDGVHVRVSHVSHGRRRATYSVDRRSDYRTEQVKSGLARFIEQAYDDEARMHRQPRPQEGRELSRIEARLDAIERRLGMCTGFQEGQGEEE